jgi:hypothetical protein
MAQQLRSRSDGTTEGFQSPMEGKVTSFDANKGWVHVKTQEGTMIVHFPPSLFSNDEEGVALQSGIRH